MRFLITDFKRGLTERSFIGALGLSALSILIGLCVYVLQNDMHTAEGAFHFSQSFVLPFIAPLIAALPYANMSMIEQDCGYKRLLLSKNNMKLYTFRRYIVNGVVSGLALVLPLILLMLGCSLLGGYENVQGIVNLLILDFIFGFSFGSIAYGLTFVNKKNYIPIVAPQVLYMLFIYAFPYLNLEKFYPPLSFSPGLIPSYSSIDNALMQLLMLNAIACILIIGRLGYEKLVIIGQGD